MENFSINITEGCNKDIKSIAEYISTVFLDDGLANKVALELFADIKSFHTLLQCLAFVKMSNLVLKE